MKKRKSGVKKFFRRISENRIKVKDKIRDLMFVMGKLWQDLTWEKIMMSCNRWLWNGRTMELYELWKDGTVDDLKMVIRLDDILDQSILFVLQEFVESLRDNDVYADWDYVG